MPLGLTDILLRLPPFALVLFRLSGLMVTAPFFAGRMVPIRIRAAMTVALAAMIFPLVVRSVPADPTLGSLLTGGVTEFLIGAAMGLSLTILLMGAEVAGELVSQQAGISIGEVINPFLDSQVSVVGQLYALVMMLFFLLAGGHREALAALLDTFDVIPVLSFQVGDNILLLLIEMLTASFMLGVRLAAPVLIALFLTGTALAFLSRTMPQLNILTVGFTLRALLMLGLAGVTLSASQDMLLQAFADGVDSIRAAFGLDSQPWRPVA